MHDRLPKGTENASLIAQLSARMALEGIDTNQTGRPVSDRDIDPAELDRAVRALGQTR